MRIDIITLFPELFAPFLKTGVTRRAYSSGAMAVHFWSPRDFAPGPYRRVDDQAFGGGPGMVMQAEPLALCTEAIRHSRGPEAKPTPLLLFSPVGKTLNHSQVAQFAADTRGFILLCGRYEGIDQRFIDHWVDLQISLGDFVLSGGEIAALAWLDAVARLQPGVLHHSQSAAQDSFHPQQQGLLDCPHYTRPQVWRGLPVPQVLLEGHHEKIAAWRHWQRWQVTACKRPDLLPANATSFTSLTTPFKKAGQ